MRMLNGVFARLFNFSGARALRALACAIALPPAVHAGFFETHPPSFYNGAEFPGATGRLERVAGELRLHYDFGGGGHYVAASCALPERPMAREIAFEGEWPETTSLTLRIVDSTGQTFQKYLPGETDGWEEFAVASEDISAHWGGANDGRVHFPLTAISFLAENLTKDVQGGDRGTLKVRNVVFREKATAMRRAAERPEAKIPFAQAAEEAGRLRDELARALPGLESAGGGAKTRAVLSVMSDFYPWIVQDVSRGFTNRAEREVRELVRIGRDEKARLARVAAGVETDPPVPHYVTSPIEIRGADTIATRQWPDGRRERGNVFLTGFGHFGMIQREMEKMPPIGNHVLQMEIGPNSFLPDENAVNTNAIAPFLAAAARGAKENVQVCLLLSPHYFPKWALRKWPELEGCAGGFFKYCVHDERAQGVIEKSLRAVIPLIRGNPALHSVCLSNEPEQGFFGPSCALRAKWPVWLKERYGTVEGMNAQWGTAYAAFADVPMPSSWKEAKKSPETLAFIRFSHEAFTRFHRRMADVVHEIAPEIPVHSKIMIFAGFHGGATYFSVDPEDFGALSDYNGNDCYDNPTPGAASGWAHSWWQMEAGYDFQRSVADKPIFNTENHLIPDRCKAYVPGDHVYAALWQNAVHGQAATTLWAWERAYDDGKSDFNGLILERPECLAAWARCSLDLSRLADELSPIRNQPPTILLHWSLASQAMSGARGGRFLRVYRAANFLGQPLGVATERMLAEYGKTGVLRRPLDSARVLLLPDVSHVPPEVRAGIDRLALGGVKVVSCAEGGEKRLARQFAEAAAAWNLPDFPRIHAPDGPGGVFGVESRGCVRNGKAYVTCVNHMDRPLKVRLARPGRDLITGAAVPAVFELKPLVPMFIEH